MSSEKEPGLRRAGRGTPQPDQREALELARRLQQTAGGEHQHPLPEHSISMDSPRYAEVRKNFEKKHIPLELMDYALGLTPLPQRSDDPHSNEAAHITDALKKYGNDISNALNLAYGAHIRKMDRDPEYRAAWEASGATWDAHDLERTLSALPADLHEYARGTRAIPDTEEGSLIRASINQATQRPFVAIPVEEDTIRATKDLPPMSPEIRERIREYPAAVNYAIIMFTRQLKDGEFDDDLRAKFARYFAEEVEEKAFRQNPNVRDRSRYENAYWAMLALGVVKERWASKRKERHPEVHVQSNEVARQIDAFLVFEKIRRLENERGSTDDDGRSRIDSELAKLRTNDTYIAARSDFYKGIVPEEALADPAIFENARTPTIIEALGNRLYVATRSLPIEKNDIEAALADREGADEAAETKRLPSDLRFRHRLLSRSTSTTAIESSNASRDVDALASYLNAEGVWNDSVQEGFDLMLKGISTSAQSIRTQKDMIADALAYPKIPKHGVETFKKHEETVLALEKSIRAIQGRLLELWHAHSHEGKASPVRLEARRANELAAKLEESLRTIESLEKAAATLEAENALLAQEADDHLSSLEILRPKIRSVIEHTNDFQAKARLQAAMSVIDEYLSIPSAARRQK